MDKATHAKLLKWKCIKLTGKWELGTGEHFRKAVLLEMRVAVALCFYSCTCDYCTINKLFGIGQLTGSNILHEVSEVVKHSYWFIQLIHWKNLLRSLMKIMEIWFHRNRDTLLHSHWANFVWLLKDGKKDFIICRGNKYKWRWGGLQGGMGAAPPPFFIAKEKRNSFKPETIKRLSPQSKCYYFTILAILERLELKIFFVSQPCWVTILFSVQWPLLQFEIHLSGPALLKPLDTSVQNKMSVVAACCTLHNVCELKKQKFFKDWLQNIDLDLG